MNAIPYRSSQEDWEDQADEPLALPGRPRRRFWGPATALLLSLLVGAICFYVGIRVEKGQVNSSSVAGTGTGAAARALTRTGAATGASTGTGATGRTGAASGFPAGGGGALAGALGRGGNASVGTVSSVSGNTIFLTDFTGNTVKVKLSSATAITKSLGVSKSSVHPGDTIIVQGLKGPNGNITATTVSDSGNRGGGSGTGSGSGSGGSATSASSAVNSLFGGGG